MRTPVRSHTLTGTPRFGKARIKVPSYTSANAADPSWVPADLPIVQTKEEMTESNGFTGLWHKSTASEKFARVGARIMNSPVQVRNSQEPLGPTPTFALESGEPSWNWWHESNSL
jgi:hypothetical protein